MEYLALFLAALAVVLAVPLPKLLHQARFRARSPWAAMLLWQAIALAGGLSIVGAPIIYGLAPFGDSLPLALRSMIELISADNVGALEELDVHLTHLFALFLGALLGAHLLLTLIRTYLRVLSARRRHRQLVKLLSTPLSAAERPAEAQHLTDTQIIDHDAPMAYCLPGRTHSSSMTVLSRGLLDQLSHNELDAVVAHEKTHLAQRHHLLTMAFEAWYRALPWLPTTRYGREAVLELTEMLADDGALSENSREDLLRSLALSSPQEPEQTRGEASSTSPSVITGPRLQRLLIPQPALGAAARAAVVFSAAALLAVPTVLVLLS